MNPRNLKLALVELGNRLVQDFGYSPHLNLPPQEKSTTPIKDFLHYLDLHPEAALVLKQLGYDWQ